MSKFQVWFAKSPIASMLRTFAAIIIAMFLADGADIFAVDSTDLKLWVAAAFSATLPTIVRALNPADTSFGAGTGKGDRFDIWGDK